MLMFSGEYKKIGLNIMFYRKKQGLTQEELSELSGVSRCRISDIERGKQSFKFDSLLLIAKALDIDYRLLLK